MTSNIQLKRAIESITETRRRYQLSPQQFRYVCKKVRENEKLQVPKARKALPEFLNAAEIYRLLDVTKEKTFDNLLIEFQIKTGLRIGETTKLLVQDIDFQNNQLKVRQGKGNKDRNVALAHSMQRRLLTYLNGRKTGFLFCKKDGRQYSIRALQYKIENAIKMAGFEKKLSTHSLRHTFACALLSKGMSLEQIKLLMGHSHITTTEIYAKLELGSVKDQLLRIME